MFAPNASTSISCTAAARCQGFGPRLARGFTMVEVMIVVAIVGILAAIAIPNYIDNMKRGRIVEATTQLTTARVRLEQFFQDNRTYTGFPSASCPTSNTHFAYTCTIGPAAYLLSAAGQGDLAGYSFSINQAGTQNSATPSSVGNGCWVTKKGGVC